MLAASQICHSQSIWSQLAIQNSSGVGLDGEVNLTSAVVAVVKAAAAVLKVASDASLQAKLMVDEPLITCNSKSSTHSGITPAFRKPENLDVILKATKLVVEAVSQAVKIMTMGEPISPKFAELVEAGSNGYWDGLHISSEQLSVASIVEDERFDMSG